MLPWEIKMHYSIPLLDLTLSRLNPIQIVCIKFYISTHIPPPPGHTHTHTHTHTLASLMEDLKFVYCQQWPVFLLHYLNCEPHFRNRCRHCSSRYSQVISLMYKIYSSLVFNTLSPTADNF